MTTALYNENAYLREFDAAVLCCEKTDGGYAVELTQTAFYPEGGGQPCDRGTLGDAHVLDVQLRDDTIVHLCDAPVCGTVHGSIDWARRFDLMQQHSGEHLVSGCIHNRFGYDNVGFHMGADVITIDLNGTLSPDDLAQLEREANEAIWADTETEIFCPPRDELCKLSYRSKKELSGTVRLVRFAGVDTCACCGTHVRRTGEIGIIKLLSCVKFRDGVRVELLCGARAYAYLAQIAAQNHEISCLLSAKPAQTAAAVQRAMQELSDAKATAAAREQRLFAQLASAYRDKPYALLFESALSPDSLRRLCVALMEQCAGVCAVFCDGKYAVGQTNGDVRPLVQALNGAFRGRGGGKPFFAQGSLCATVPELEAFFDAYRNR